jgi:hypothetical protein
LVQADPVGRAVPVQLDQVGNVRADPVQGEAVEVEAVAVAVGEAGIVAALTP